MRTKLQNLPFLLRFVILNTALFVIAVAIVFQVQAGLGYTPWNVLSDGLGKLLGTTLGRGEIIISLSVICCDIIAKERLGIGTVCNGLLIGIFFDFVNASGLVPASPNIVVGILYLVLSTMVMGVACVFYIGVGFGAGPRDSFMVVTMRLTGKSLLVCRLCTEVVVCVVGYLIGGTVGIGTIILTLITGPIMNACFKFANINPKDIPHDCFYPFHLAKKNA